MSQERDHRMLKMARFLTRPTLARRDASFPKGGRSERRWARRRLVKRRYFSIALRNTFYWRINPTKAAELRFLVSESRVPVQALRLWSRQRLPGHAPNAASPVGGRLRALPAQCSSRPFYRSPRAGRATLDLSLPRRARSHQPSRRLLPPTAPNYR